MRQRTIEPLLVSAVVPCFPLDRALHPASLGSVEKAAKRKYLKSRGPVHRSGGAQCESPHGASTRARSFGSVAHALARWTVVSVGGFAGGLASASISVRRSPRKSQMPKTERAAQKVRVSCTSPMACRRQPQMQLTRLCREPCGRSKNATRPAPNFTRRFTRLRVTSELLVFWRFA